MFTLLGVLLLLIFLLALASIWWYATIPKNLPPGPIGLPFLGSSLYTIRADTARVKLEEWQKKYGNVFKIYVADKLLVVLCDWESIQEALVKQGDVYAGRPVFKSLFPKVMDARAGIANAEGEVWKEQRRFALSTLRDFGFGRPIIEPNIKAEVEIMISEIGNANGQPMDVSNIINNAVSNVINVLVFGRRFEYNDKEFEKMLVLMRARLTQSGISFLAPFVLSERVAQITKFLPQAQKMINQGLEFATWVTNHIKEATLTFSERHGEDPTNYVHAFRKVQMESDPATSTFTDTELTATVTNLFIGGTDTTATTLRWAVYFLASHPDLQEAVHQEIREQIGISILPNYSDRTKLPLTEATILETQRAADLVPFGVVRRTLAPSRLFGYDIPEDTIIVPMLTNVLNDPEVYPEPEKFNPYRFLGGKNAKSAQFNQFIPFQIGKRVCPGEPLAKMELFIFFVGLVSRFKFSFPPGKPIPSSKGVFSIIRAPEHYEICAIARND